MGDKAVEVDIGASGLSVGVHLDEVPYPPTMQRATRVCIELAEVEIVEARLKREDACEHYLDVHFVDDNDVAEDSRRHNGRRF